MIHKLRICGFKTFTDATFKMASLTVLAGMNGAGKTSVIHALLLIREVTRRTDQVVPLNGPFGLELGTFENIQNWNSQDSIHFDITDKEGTLYSWAFAGNPAALYAKERARNNLSNLYNCRFRHGDIIPLPQMLIEYNSH